MPGAAAGHLGGCVREMANFGLTAKIFSAYGSSSGAEKTPH